MELTLSEARALLEVNWKNLDWFHGEISAMRGFYLQDDKDALRKRLDRLKEVFNLYIDISEKIIADGKDRLK